MVTLCAVTQRIAVLGSNRGIGRALCKRLSERAQLLMVSRKFTDVNFSAETFVCDLTRSDQFMSLVNRLKEFSPDSIFYVAGGGPYGRFESKEWKDHQWALELNFLLPAKLIHLALNGGLGDRLKQFVVFGSSVAEETADPFAASYSSSKHALLGLVRSLRAEGCNLDLRIFSPPYVDTELLPPNASVRGEYKIYSPEEIVDDFLDWVRESTEQFHRKFDLK